MVVEDFGGDVLSQEISAKKGTGVPELLEKVLLQADLLELTANADRRASGAVVEAQLDPGTGPVATAGRAATATSVAPSPSSTTARSTSRPT